MWMCVPSGACLLLAAKLFTDIKRPDVIALIDVSFKLLVARLPISVCFPL